MRRSRFLDRIGRTGAAIALALAGCGVFAAQAVEAATPPAGGHPWFVQISDNHIGFNKAAKPDVSAALQKAFDEINSLAVKPAFVVHAGDITHLATPAHFDTAKHILGTLKRPLLTVPSERDTLGTRGTRHYFDAFGNDNQRQGIQPTKDGWCSFGRGSTHFVTPLNMLYFEKMAQADATPLEVDSSDGPSNDARASVQGCCRRPQPTSA